MRLDSTQYNRGKGFRTTELDSGTELSLILEQSSDCATSRKGVAPSWFDTVERPSTYSGRLAAARLFIAAAMELCKAAQLCVFILGTWYLGLGVLRHVFGVRYAVSVLVSMYVPWPGGSSSQGLSCSAFSTRGSGIVFSIIHRGHFLHTLFPKPSDGGGHHTHSVSALLLVSKRVAVHTYFELSH